MSDDDRAYFGRRAEQERALAKAANDEKIRLIHLHLASTYDELVVSIEKSLNRRS